MRRGKAGAPLREWLSASGGFAAIAAALAIGACSDATTAPPPRAVNVVSAAPVQRVDVSPTASLEVGFDRPIDPSTITGRFIVSGRASGRIAGVLAASEDGLGLIFQPASPMKAGDLVTATLTEGLRSIEGTPLQHAYTFQFRVATAASGFVFQIEDTPLGTAGANPGPASVFSGDFDGDGVSDLLIADTAARDVRLYRNDRSGGFGDPQILTFGETVPLAVQGVDANGDGVLDALAVDGTLRLFHGQAGSALVAAAQQVDANVTAFCGSAGAGGVVTYDEQNLFLVPIDAGSFGSSREEGVAPGFSACAVADVNGDGLLDLLVGYGGAAARVDLYEGTESPRDFRLAGTLAELADAGVPRAIVAGDFNGDGRADFVVASGAALDVFLQQGTDAVEFGPAGQIATFEPVTGALALGDIDGDGDLDLVSGGRAISVTAAENDGAGHFSPATAISFPAGAEITALVVDDLDGDGDLDIGATTTDGQLHVLRGEG